MLTDKFILPKGSVYMCGHSLGPMPAIAVETLKTTLADFGSYGVSAWNKSNWIDLPYVLGEKIAKLIGARADEVLVADSTTVNLYKAIKSALKLQSSRNIILTTSDNFPADLYVVHGINGFDDCKVKIVHPEKLLDSIDDSVAVLTLTQTNYRDSSVLDIKKICTIAKQFGVLTVFDLSHSVGIVPLDLQDSGVDFAVGCTYKYLSGGPGSPAFIYANAKHHQLMKSPIQGWMGHDDPFAFESEYYASGIKKFMSGTPGILSMKGLEAALDLFSADLIVTIHAKAMEYSEILYSALKDLGVVIQKPHSRGGHVFFLHSAGYSISRALIDYGVICDYRSPDLIRLCVNPLYITHQDIDFCIKQIATIINKKLYLKEKYHQKLKVT